MSEVVGSFRGLNLWCTVFAYFFLSGHFVVIVFIYYCVTCFQNTSFWSVFRLGTFCSISFRHTKLACSAKLHGRRTVVAQECEGRASLGFIVCAVEYEAPTVLCNAPFSYCKIDACKLNGNRTNNTENTCKFTVGNAQYWKHNGNVRFQASRQLLLRW
jgi:hypothetical protein